jgi:multidrug efflux pump subunit AcrA (membrane-fusion protein)
MKLKPLIGAVIAAGMLALAAWGSVTLYRAANTATAAPIPFTKVKRGDVTFAVYARGELQGGNSIMLQAPMVGGAPLAITELRGSGELVKKDDVVVQFDTTDQAYKLKEAEADLAEAEQKVVQAQAQMEAKEEEDRYALIKARADLKQAELEARKNPLVGVIQARENDLAVRSAKDTVSQLDHDQGNRKANSLANMKVQEALRDKAKVQAETARQNIERMTLRAPREGYVSVQVNSNINFFMAGMTLPLLQVGDTVRAGMAVVQLPDLEHWEVMAHIAEADRGHLAVAQPVQIVAVALPEHPYKGTIKDLGGTSGPAWDRRFDCRISIDNSTRELRPGMTANIVITAETLKDVLWIPAQALFETGDRQFVYLQTAQGGFTTQDVKLVRRSESKVVLTGIKEGQAVALANPDQSKDKDKGQKSAPSATQALPPSK